MVDDGVIRRIDFRTVPPHVEYELTDFGHSLAKVLAPLCEWGTRHSSEVGSKIETEHQRRHSAFISAIADPGIRSSPTPQPRRKR
jgi:DNA-binding HxlR family transcriptional regulator